MVIFVVGLTLWNVLVYAHGSEVTTGTVYVSGTGFAVHHVAHDLWAALNRELFIVVIAVAAWTYISSRQPST